MQHVQLWLITEAGHSIHNTCWLTVCTSWRADLIPLFLPFLLSLHDTCGPSCISRVEMQGSIIMPQVVSVCVSWQSRASLEQLCSEVSQAASCLPLLLIACAFLQSALTDMPRAPDTRVHLHVQVRQTGYDTFTPLDSAMKFIRKQAADERGGLLEEPPQKVGSPPQVQVVNVHKLDAGVGAWQNHVSCIRA